jgi:hypothetical protein
MHHRKLLRTFAASLLFTCLIAARGEERGYWRAASNSARDVTGDITLADEKLTINFSTTAISKARALEPAEVSAVFDTDAATAGAGSLYHLNIPAAKKFLKKNTLCGAEDVRWMVAYASGNTLQIAFFSGDKPPVLTFEAISGSADRCGTYTYVK